MRRYLAAMLSLLLMLNRVPVVLAAEGDVTSHYVTYDQFACIRNDDADFSGFYDKTKFDVWSRGQNTSDPKNPVRAGYWKFDLDDYLNAKNELKTAVLLFAGIQTSYPSSVKLYECTENVVTGSGYLDVPTADTGSSLGYFTLQNAESVSAAYPGVGEKYNVAMDISTYAKTLARSGDKDFTFMMYPEWGGSVYGFLDAPVLYIETTEVIDKSNILSPVASVYTGSQISTTTKPLSNGGGYLYAYPTVNPNKPGKALFYKFDLSKYANGDVDIKKADYLQMTNSPGYSRLFYIYDVPENNLENGQVYKDVSTPAEDAVAVGTVSSPGSSTVINREMYPGVEYDYNFCSDLTDYIKGKIKHGADSITLMVYPGYQTTAGYDLLSPPVLYITPDEIDPDTVLSEAVMSPEAWVYTCWGDDTQTSKPYKPQDQAVGNYWLYGNGTGVDIYLGYNDYWQKPKRALYHKFDFSKYVKAGYSVKGAYILQKSGNGHVSIIDCPENDLEYGDVYNTVPDHEKKPAVQFSVGSNTNTYYTADKMQERFPGSRSGDNMAVNITSYIKDKIAEGNTSFTFMEYARYAGDRACFSNYGQLYLELEKSAKVEITKVSDAYQNQEFTISAKASHKDGIDRVDFYVGDELVGTDSEAESGSYQVSVKDIDAGEYSLRAVAVSASGAYTVAEVESFQIRKIYESIPAEKKADGYSLDVSLLDTDNIEKAYITVGVNSTAYENVLTISDANGVVAEADTKNIQALDAYNYGAPIKNNLALDVTDYIKSASGNVTFDIDVKNAEQKAEPILYARYRTVNSAIDKSFKKEALAQGFSEFSGVDKLYLAVPEGALLSDFLSVSTADSIKAVSSDGAILGNSDMLNVGDKVFADDKEYYVIKNGFISDAKIRMSYGKSEATAYVEVFDKDFNGELILAGYDNHDRLVAVEKSEYVGANSGIFTVTCANENAYYYKVMLLDMNTMKPYIDSVRKDRQVIVLKADDFTVDSSHYFETYREILAKRGLKAGIGVIVASLDKDNPNYNTANNYADRLRGATEVIHRALASGFEFWHHGYLHSDREFCEWWQEGGNVVGFNKDKQRESFKKGYDVLNNNFDTEELDLQVHSFGSPANRATQLTIDMISESFPEVKVLMRGNKSLKMPEGMINLGQDQTAAMEYQVPAAQYSVCIDYERFLQSYAQNSHQSVLCIQMHPGLWEKTDPKSFDEFEKCVDYLMEQGAVFMTPYEYYNYITR